MKVLKAMFPLMALAMAAIYGQVVINEFQYDDTGAADDRERVAHDPRDATSRRGTSPSCPPTGWWWTA